MQQVVKLQKEIEALKQQGTRGPTEGVRQPEKEQPMWVAITPEATPPATRTTTPGGTAVPPGTPPMMPRVPDLLFLGLPRNLEKDGWNFDEVFGPPPPPLPRPDGGF